MNVWQIGFKVTEIERKHIDAFVKKHGYKSRADAMRQIIIQHIIRERLKEKA